MVLLIEFADCSCGGTLRRTPNGFECNIRNCSASKSDTPPSKPQTFQGALIGAKTGLIASALRMAHVPCPCGNGTRKQMGAYTCPCDNPNHALDLATRKQL